LNQRHGNGHWINPLLTRLNLVRKAGTDFDPTTFWRQIEEFQLAERVGRLVAEVNAAAGYHVLEMMDYLPPQKNILRVSFERHRAKHNLEIVIREYGIALMFSTTKRASTGWERYLPPYSARDNSSLVWEQVIYPVEVSEQNIQAWLSYLLSGLDKEFRLDQILHASPNPEAELSANLRKLSA
jgi:hypothetical protein